MKNWQFVLVIISTSLGDLKKFVCMFFGGLVCWFWILSASTLGKLLTLSPVRSWEADEIWAE